MRPAASRAAAVYDTEPEDTVRFPDAAAGAAGRTGCGAGAVLRAGARQGGRKTADSRSVRRDLSLTAGGQVRAHLSHPLRAGDHGVSGRDPPRQCAADRE